jgi:CBS domain-containing protein
VSTTSSEVTVSDVMLRRPKTLPADVTVADARAALEHASVKMLLLVDGDRFYGAVTDIPDDAASQDAAIGYVDTSAPVVAESTPVAEALERLEHRPSGRLIVLAGEELVGLVCLAKDGVTFCGSELQAS